VQCGQFFIECLLVHDGSLKLPVYPLHSDVSNFVTHLSHAGVFKDF